MEKKAISLLSGGLDSTLATKMILDQGIEAVALHFTSPFCTCTPRKRGCKSQAHKISQELGLPLKVMQKGMEYMKIVENPPHGYGRGMNPCIDCRIFTLQKAKAFMDEIKASFVVTGEVLGQRPMSQRRDTIRIIERESGLKGLIVRPLSAHLFDPTIPEREGIVDRRKFLAIAGRSRKTQIRLAVEHNLRDYPCPAGGCLLTDKVISARLKDLFRHCPDYKERDLRLLRIGRHLRVDEGLKVIVGRNESENRILRYLAGDDMIYYISPDFPSPLILACGRLREEEKGFIGGLIMHYGKWEGKTAKIQAFRKEELLETLYVPEKIDKGQIKSKLIT